MMSILKDMKETYDSKPADIDTSQLSERMNAMYEQADAIHQECFVTAEDMADIVVNYVAQTGFNEKTQELLKTLCLQMFKGVK